MNLQLKLFMMRLKYDFIIQEVAGTYVAVAVGNGAEHFKDMVKMNGTAKRIFELVQQGLPENDIVERMLCEYKGDVDVISQSVANLLDELRRKDLIVES